MISTNLGTLTLASGSAENLDDSSESNSSLIHCGFKELYKSEIVQFVYISGS